VRALMSTSSTPDGMVFFQHACKMGLEGLVFQATGVTLPIGPSLAQVQESGGSSGEA
jgi:hypothetical protein